MSDEVQTTQANKWHCSIGEVISGLLQMVPGGDFGSEAIGEHGQRTRCKRGGGIHGRSA